MKHDGFVGFDGFGGSGKHLVLLLLVLQNTVQRDDRDGFGGFGGFGRDGYPPETQPPFFVILIRTHFLSKKVSEPLPPSMLTPSARLQ